MQHLFLWVAAFINRELVQQIQFLKAESDTLRSSLPCRSARQRAQACRDDPAQCHL